MKQFTFWKNNRNDQQHTKTGDELAAAFKLWLPGKEVAWLNYYNSDRIIRHFLTSHDGICSVFEEIEYQAMYEILKPVYLEHMQTVDPSNWKPAARKLPIKRAM